MPALGCRDLRGSVAALFGHGGQVGSARVNGSIYSHGVDDDEFVSIRGITKSYPGAGEVVRDLNLSIKKGEFITLLGPSGSGKSTVLMLLSGFEQPDRGTVYTRGRDYASLPPKARNIGIVFQDYALFPHMTVAENVGFPLRVRRVARGEARRAVSEALSLVKLDGLDQRKPSALSGGQRQRVALARALVFKPDLVLMDEPLSALDRQLRDHMQIEIKHLHEKLGVTVVYVTHDQAEALTLSDRIVVLNHGRIEQVGTPEQVYNQSANLFVAQFIGESNCLEGQVMAVEAGLALVKHKSGALMRCAAVDPVSVGQRVSVSIRPENLQLRRDRADDHHLSGHVTETIYYGDHKRVVAKLATGGEISVKIGKDPAEAPFEVGSLVSLAWRPEDARVFASGGVQGAH